MLSENRGHREPKHTPNPQGHTPQASDKSFWNPHEYSKVAPELQHREGLDLLKLHGLVGDECVVDIGAGDGGLSLLIIDRLPEGALIGIDKSEQMLEAARRNTAHLPGNAVTFVLGDIAERPPIWMRQVKEFTDWSGGLDLIFSNATLHHLYTWHEFRAALLNIHQMLTGLSAGNGGQAPVLVASFAGKGNFADLIECAEIVSQSDEWREIFSEWCGYPLLLPDEKRMRDELAAAGFDTENGYIGLVREDLSVDPQGLRDFCHSSLASYGRYLHSQLHAQALEEWNRQSNPTEQPDSQSSFVKEYVDTRHKRFAYAVAELYEQRNPPGEDGLIAFPCINMHLRVSPRREFLWDQDSCARVADFSDTGARALSKSQEQQLIKFLEDVSNLPEVREYKPAVRGLLNVQPGMVVIDAGAGLGANSRWIAEDLKGEGVVMALDRSLPQLVYANENNLRGNEMTVSLHADLMSIPLQDNSCDAVLCERLFLHTHNSDAILSELFRVLRPGGHAVMVEFNFAGLHFDSDDQELTRKICDARALELTNPRAGACLEKQLVAAGFDNLQVIRQDVSHPYESSKLLDLEDIRSAAGKPLYPSQELIEQWCAEQHARAVAGTFYAKTPMYLIKAYKPGHQQTDLTNHTT